VLALVASAAPARAQVDLRDLERRLEEQERRLVEQQQRLEEQERELARQREDLLGLRGAGAGATAGPGDEGGRGWSFGGYGLPDPERDRRVRVGIFFIEGQGHRIELRGRVHFDGRFIAEHGRDDVDNSFILRRARLELRGTFWRRLDFELSAELGQGEAELFEAYLNLRVARPFELKVGQMRTPFGLSRTTSSNYQLHPERPIAMAALIPGRDIGAMIHGTFFGERLRYVLGVYDGIGANVESDTDDDFDLIARLELRPLDGLLLGASFAFSPPDHDADGPSDVKTVGDEVTEFLDYDGDTRRRDHRVRAGADARLRLGPLEVAAEGIVDQMYAVASDANELEDLYALGGAVDVAWLLTGEDRENHVDPRRPLFSEGEWGPGAFEVALRFEHFRVDPDTVRRGFAEGTDRVDSATATLSWYPWRAIRVMFSYSYSTFDDTVTVSSGDRVDDDHVIVTRIAAYW
jgi:phosphate-selective porin OprO/OprP